MIQLVRLKIWRKSMYNNNSAKDGTPSSYTGTECTSITDFSDNGATYSSTYYG